ncbi:MAG: UDP-glucose 4-epimerase GalE [Alphaproteobacteria bacterium]|nr:UDP-glucose 4-epimerase GalE [Alphaproteobacteria bacterium]
MNDRRVLVTGGAGYIGSHACKALARAGYTPIAYDNLSAGHTQAVKWGPLVQADLADRARLAQTLRDQKVTSVMHFAASAYVGVSMKDPSGYFQNNVVNTLGLLDEMRVAGIGTIVFSSTCATYGTPDRVPIDETMPQRPINPYGESKLFVERVLKWYAVAYGLSWAALRYFNAAGADPDCEIGEEHDPETHLVPLAIQTALGQRSSLDVFGSDYPTSDGTAVRDYIHVTDLAEAHVRALDRLAGSGGELQLNLGTGQGHSVRQVIDTVERASGRRVAQRMAPRRPGDPAVLVADAGRANRELGWRPAQSDLDTIVRTALAWHRRAATPRRVAAG